MQQSAKPQKAGGNSQYQSIIITAITLFALAGAILGFAIGALNHQRTPQQVANNSNNNNNKPAAKPTTAVKPTATPTPSVVAQPVGCPAMSTANNIDGVTFTITIVAKQKLIAGCPNHPESASTIANDFVTCRIWLAKAKDDQHPVIEKADTDLFNKPESFATPFPNEVPNGLVFSNGASQTQMCKQGQANWNVSLSPALEKGKYFIVGLTSWGVFYNWSWSGLLIKK
ncbi:hypothetical protein KDW_32910 [Dictyobacter vulcani]|uniref:Uncharacterized protein n=1 Tax=Dictyobacter vulcani TaxID=2607529 RepID=A0A5J4KSQ1_9CHLR|nr:hypothetical protein [Dictyobacter vulcani]GER89129.1 hypothetical protein KDW_32910 [Dictyobacter vulcani]